MKAIVKKFLQRIKLKNRAFFSWVLMSLFHFNSFFVFKKFSTEMWISWNASSARLLNSIGPYLFIRIMCHFCLPFLLNLIRLPRRSKEQLLPGLTSMHLDCFALSRVLTLSFFLGACGIVLSKHLPFLRSGSKKDKHLHVPVMTAAIQGPCCHPLSWGWLDVFS